MAIQKEKTLKSGVSGNYWRITAVHVDLKVMAEPFPVTFDVSLFLDAAASAALKNPVYRGKKYTFLFTRAQIISGNILALGYAAIKAKAATLVPNPFDPESEPTIPFDSDLAGGEDVL